MFRSEGLRPNLYCTPRVVLSGSEAAASVLQSTEIVIEGRNVRMVWPEFTLQDREGPPVQPLGFIEIAGVFVNHAQVVADMRHLPRLAPRRRFYQLKCLPIGPLGLDILSLTEAVLRTLVENCYPLTSHFLRVGPSIHCLSIPQLHGLIPLDSPLNLLPKPSAHANYFGVEASSNFTLVNPVGASLTSSSSISSSRS